MWDDKCRSSDKIIKIIPRLRERKNTTPQNILPSGDRDLLYFVNLTILMSSLSSLSPVSPPISLDLGFIQNSTPLFLNDSRSGRGLGLEARDVTELSRAISSALAQPHQTLTR